MNTAAPVRFWHVHQTPICYMTCYYYFELGVVGGNASCTVAPEGTVCGIPVRLASGSSRPLDKFAVLTYPLKPSYAGEPGHIPSREVDGWACIMIEISKSLIRPEGSEFALPIQSPTAFHETRRIPALPNQI